MTDRYYLAGSKAGIPPEILVGSFIFDANIWLSVNGPFGDPNSARARAYSGFFKKVIEAGAEVLLPQVVACEFLNRAIWMQAEADGFQRGTCKIHQAAEYPGWIKEACDLLNSVASDCTRVADEFDSLELESAFQMAEAGGLEFHDVLILGLCQRHGGVLVTDDKDFAGQDVPIVTFNLKLM